MLKLEVLVKQIVLEEVIAELIAIGVQSLSYAEVYAAERELHPETSNEDLPADTAFSPVIKLEVILDKGKLAAIEEALVKKVSMPLVGGAEVIITKLKDDLHILGGTEHFHDVEVI